jgi:hypothetical protein
MSRVQRERLDAQLRGSGVGYEQSVGESRENFAKLPAPARPRLTRKTIRAGQHQVLTRQLGEAPEEPTRLGVPGTGASGLLLQ